MKQCKLCKSTYDDRVDFCFRDGTPLARMQDAPSAAAPDADAGVESGPVTEEMDAPAPFMLLQSGRSAPAEPTDAEDLPTLAPPTNVQMPSTDGDAGAGDEIEAAALPEPLPGSLDWLLKPAPPSDDEEATLAGLPPIPPPVVAPAPEPAPAPAATPAAKGIAMPSPPPLLDATDEDLEGATPIGSAQITIPNFEPARVILPAVTEMPPAEPLPPVQPTPQNAALKPLPAAETQLPPATPVAVVAPPAPKPTPEPEESFDFPSNGAELAEEPAPPPKRSRAGLFALVGVGVAALIGVGILVSGGGGGEQTTTPAEPSPAPVAAAPTPAPEPAPAEPAAVEPAVVEPAAPDVAASAPAEPATTPAATPAASPSGAKPPAASAKPTAASAATATTARTTTPAPATAPAPVVADASSPWGVSTAPSSKGKLSVISTPAGARVYVDDKQVGQSPLSTDLDFGLYIVRLELDGYRATSQTLRMKDASASLSFSLDPIPVSGQVNLFGLAAGAEVWLGERKLGALPVSTRLEEGSHTFRVVLPDGSTFSQTKEIRFTNPGQPVTVTLTGS